MSMAKRGGRFSYLKSTEEGTQPKLPAEEQSGQEKNSLPGREAALNKTEASASGKERRGRTSGSEEFTSVPKGQGRMKQERSQLNVRIPTTLKRQASAKAVLDGREIGEVIEELLREYLNR